MLDIKFIRDNVEIVKKAINDKHLTLDLDRLLSLDKEIISIKQVMESELQTTNALSREMKDASPERREEIKSLSRAAGTRATEMAATLKPLEEEYKDLIARTPTIPAPNTPIGASEEDNVVVRQVGQIPEFDFEPLDQMALLEKNGWADFDHITKNAGTRSVIVRGNLFRLEMAIWQFVIDTLVSKGFTPMSVPILTNEQALFSMGQFPFDREMVYTLEKDNQYLIGTSEVALNSLHGGTILDEADLPIMYAGFSPCLRREAGASGKDTRGMIRVHQFYKVEQYIICKNTIDESNKWHAFLLNNTEEIMKALEIPYQVIACCTGDMGVGKYTMNDVEAWCPSEKKYRETHSCSSLLDWQARRTNIRYRNTETGKPEFAYTLNNTGIATPRILVPLLENHQTKDGRVRIPPALRSYMGGAEFLEPNQPMIK